MTGLLNQWIFTDKEFLITPTVKEGKDLGMEWEIRYRACRIIERVGKRLKMPQDQINMGKILLHRFYMRCSMKEYNYHEIAAAILFICGKLGSGQNFVKVERIIYYIATDAKKGSLVDMNESNNEFKHWFDRILAYEDVILEKLCFDDTPALPHVIAIKLLRSYNASEHLQKSAFWYCNEALCTTLAVRYSAEMIAYASIYAAGQATDEVVKTLHGMTWWESKKINEQRLKIVSMEIVSAANLVQWMKITERIVKKLDTKYQNNSPMRVPSSPALASPNSCITSVSPKLNTVQQKLDTDLKSRSHAKYSSKSHHYKPYGDQGSSKSIHTN